VSDPNENSVKRLSILDNIDEVHTSITEAGKARVRARKVVELCMECQSCDYHSDLPLEVVLYHLEEIDNWLVEARKMNRIMRQQMYSPPDELPF
jgi:hypothetical protein